MSNPKSIETHILSVKKLKLENKSNVASKLFFEDIVYDASRIDAHSSKIDIIASVVNALCLPRKRSLYPQKMSNQMKTVQQLQHRQMFITVISACDLPQREMQAYHGSGEKVR